MFSIYVNDLPTVCDSCNTEGYVDDTKILVSFTVEVSDVAEGNINNDLKKVRNWCFDNCLLLNPDKTKLMVFGSRPMIRKLPDFSLSMLGKEIVPSKTAKDLGVIFDPFLSFDDHNCSDSSILYI